MFKLTMFMFCLTVVRFSCKRKTWIVLIMLTRCIKYLAVVIVTANIDYFHKSCSWFINHEHDLFVWAFQIMRHTTSKPVSKLHKVPESWYSSGNWTESRIRNEIGHIRFTVWSKFVPPLIDQDDERMALKSFIFHPKLA